MTAALRLPLSTAAIGYADFCTAPAHFLTNSTATHHLLQDISAVDDARHACQAAGQAIPEGFVRVVQMRPARPNAKHA